MIPPHPVLPRFPSLLSFLGFQVQVFNLYQLSLGFLKNFFFFEKKKRDSRVPIIVPRSTEQLGKPMDTTSLNWDSEISNPHTHPRLYWFLRLLEIAITVLVRTRTWDVVKPQQSPTSCTGRLSQLITLINCKNYNEKSNVRNNDCLVFSIHLLQ